MENTGNIQPLIDIMKRLRGPNGCPWDLKQSIATLGPYLIEEAYEVLSAILQEANEDIREELGDLLYLIVFIAQIGSEADLFNLEAVIDGAKEKLIRRHPHVFGDVTVKDAEQVVLNWDQIKRAEKKPRLVEDVDKGLPALIRAYQISERAKSLGLDWNQAVDIVDKIEEELKELRSALEAGKPSEIGDELGDLIFSVVNLGRFLKINPEIALNGALDKFLSRYQFVKKQLSVTDPLPVSIEALDKLWAAAKNQK